MSFAGRTFNHTAPCAVKRAGIVDDIGAGSSIIRQSKRRYGIWINLIADAVSAF